MSYSTFNVQGSGRTLRTSHSALRTYSSGFTYIALLAAIVIIGISMSAAGKYWQNVMMRDKEEELLFRGGQYRRAIERYYMAKQPFTCPANIEDLLKDDRFPQAKRHLRQQYKDPITGEDFELLRDQARGNRIIAVYSKSEAEPLQQSGFSEENKEFEGKKQYKDGKFQPVIQQPGQPGQLIRPGQPGQPGVPGQPVQPAPPVQTAPPTPGLPVPPIGPGSVPTK